MKEIKEWLLSAVIASTITISAWYLIPMRPNASPQENLLGFATQVTTQTTDTTPKFLEQATQTLESSKTKKDTFDFYPKKLVIKKIKVNSDVELVAKDNEGRMDVPKSVDNVGWYRLGTIPGEIGQSVIAGHLDSKTGPAVFANLNKLNVGDVIEIVSENNKTLSFKIYSKRIYKDTQFPIKEVFGSKEFSGLNLITCRGTFDPKSQNYSERLVVFSKLVN